MLKEAADPAASLDSFSNLTLVNSKTNETDSGKLIRTWIGHVHTDVGQLSNSYCRMRNELADAACFSGSGLRSLSS